MSCSKFLALMTNCRTRNVMRDEKFGRHKSSNLVILAGTVPVLFRGSRVVIASCVVVACLFLFAFFGL